MLQGEFSIFTDIFSNPLAAYYVQKLLVAFVFLICSSIAITVSVLFYNKSIGVKAKKGVYVLTFIFNWIGALIYFTELKDKPVNKEKTPKQTKQKTASICFFIIFCISFICSLFSGVFIKNDEAFDYINSFNPSVCYDRNGNEYSNVLDVVYYTEDGCNFVLKTKYDDELSVTTADYIQRGTYNGKYKDQYLASCAYLDKNGYIVFFEYKSPKVDDEKFYSDEKYCYYDENGEYYTNALYKYWNENGELCN